MVQYPQGKPNDQSTVQTEVPPTASTSRHTPAPMGTGEKVKLGVGAGLGVVGIILMVLVGNNLSICGSGFGQFAQAVSSQASTTCGVDSAVNIVGWLLLLGGIGLAAWVAWVRYRAKTA